MSKEHMLIECEPKPWKKEGTIHIFWPSAVANEDDDRFVAWCREDAKGELKSIDELTPIENEERICKTCMERAMNSRNIEAPGFISDIHNKGNQSSVEA